MDNENFISHLPQPKRFAPSSPQKGLNEITASANNARNGTMLPPPQSGLKRPASNLPEPQPKRKTLAERAGEPYKQTQAAPRSNAPISNSVAYTVARGPSSSSSSMSRSTSNASRTTSNSSFSQSVGPGIKPPTAYGRPKSSLAKARSVQAVPRPATVLGNREQPKEDVKPKSWDPEEQYGNMERMYQDVCSHYKEAMEDNSSFRETTGVYKEAVAKLEEEKSALTGSIIILKAEVETSKYRINSVEREKVDVKRAAEEELEEVRRTFRIEMESIKQGHRDEVERMKSDQREEVRDVKRRYEEELESERTQRIQALSQVSTTTAIEKQKQQIEIDTKDREIMTVKSEADRINAGLDRERAINDELRQNLANAGNNAASMETSRQELQKKIDYLESDNKSQSEAYTAMERKMNEAIIEAVECMEKLRKEETLRRKLHNQVQELKGNIRVFCRVRPNHATETEGTARIMFPDEDESKQIEVRGPEETSSLGKVTTKKYDFEFDRVFDTTAQNSVIFEEISQLIQSALDGFNVCIFAYGQTGSGKTYTMSSEDGMIPQALRQIYSTSKELESRGWKYTMEGSFIEVYNEEIRDLLGEEGKSEKAATKKHEIHHDTIRCETTITNVTTLSLDSQDQVEGILEQAMSRRSVAATSANERSSRSHSVFILKLQGYNTITNEKSKGTLNLVDLAGSERLNNSKVEGARLKETQNINKSLSCLGDVIGALGQQSGGAFNPRASVNGNGDTAAHIPYRNSKLTYLLQYSLSGNSKTLMFVMVAPEKKHLQETITSLKFAEKVSNTKIGVAKKIR